CSAWDSSPSTFF
nr:immunoglobulin light chain junction region [Macaca mulatta]